MKKRHGIICIYLDDAYYRVPIFEQNEEINLEEE